MLKQDRPQHSGSLTSDGRDNLCGFSYSYQGGESRGAIQVRRVDVTDERMELIIFIYEHDDR